MIMFSSLRAALVLSAALVPVVVLGSIQGEQGDVEAEKAVSKLQSQFLGVNKKIDDLQNDATDVKKGVEGLQNDMTGVKKGVEDLQNDMTGVKKDITDVKKDITDVKDGQERGFCQTAKDLAQTAKKEDLAWLNRQFDLILANCHIKPKYGVNGEENSGTHDQGDAGIGADGGKVGSGTGADGGEGDSGAGADGGQGGAGSGADGGKGGPGAGGDGGAAADCDGGARKEKTDTLDEKVDDTLLDRTVVDLPVQVGLGSKGAICTYLIRRELDFLIAHMVSAFRISPDLGRWDPEGRGCVAEPCHGGGWGTLVVVESVPKF